MRISYHVFALQDVIDYARGHFQFVKEVIMPYSMDWIIDKRVLHVVLAGELDSDTIRDMVEQSRKMTHEGIHPIHAIADATRAESVPKYINQIVKQFKGVQAEDTGFTVIIANSLLTRFFAQLLLKVMRLEMRFAADVDEALVILRQIDPTLPIEILPPPLEA